jgi:NADH-quinone oxidoreductase subunit L
MMAVVAIILSLFLPLLGGLLAFVFRKKQFSIAGIGLAFVCSLFLIFNQANLVASFEWLPGFEISLRLDPVACILISLVLFISLLVHFFSLEYMREDGGKFRYFGKLGFFTFSMVGLLLADHLILLFVFWELVGLASYLLIGFWYQKDDVPSSARQAFMINRVADVALLMGILVLNTSGSLTISEMNEGWLFLPSILVAIGAFGKSAQLPFAGWLTKAMVGPTPVSALIHAATMVAAGVYLLFRVSPFLHTDALLVIAFVGAFTALYGGICALFQHDIKKVLAYSTISQLGYMVMGVGVGGEAASIFHLFTHAFFKAGLFLAAGVIIHFMHHASKTDDQDMRNMGGLRKQLPWTFRSFLICSLALAGIPFFSGFMSKEGIILSAWTWAEQHGNWAYVISDIALITAFLTALYVGRMVLLVFFGEARSSFKIDFKEPLSFKIPLIVLALGSLWFFQNWNPFAHEGWINGVLNNSLLEGSVIVTFLSILLATSGIGLSVGLFKPGSQYALNYANQPSRFSFARNGMYLTQVYDRLGSGVLTLSRISCQIDQKVIDGLVHFIAVGSVVISKTIALIDRFVVDGPVNGVGHVSAFIGRRLAGISSRDIQTQLAWLLVGVILILSWILFL